MNESRPTWKSTHDWVMSHSGSVLWMDELASHLLWVGHVPHETVTSHIDKARDSWMSHITWIRVTSLVKYYPLRMGHVTYTRVTSLMHESCHMHDWVMSHSGSVRWMDEPGVMSHTIESRPSWRSHVTHTTHPGSVLWMDEKSRATSHRLVKVGGLSSSWVLPWPLNS